MDGVKTFRGRENLQRSAILAHLKGQFQLSSSTRTTRSSRLYDTFDWRLYKADLMLRTIDSSELLLQSITTGEIVEREAMPALLPRFWWDFPDSALKGTLKSTIDIRALIRIVDFTERSATYALLNEDQKTVVRIIFYTINGIDPSAERRQVEYVALFPLRGYADEYKAVHDQLVQLDLQTSPENAILTWIRECGIEPGAYTSKINVPLAPDERCSQAMRKILRQMYSVIIRNEDGIRRDIDSEFLHDYRVAVRRTRAALGQIKNIFPQEQYLRFRDDFKYLGQLSNRLRDLDVYLLNKERYREMLPKDLRPGLTTLFRSLQSERRRRHRDFVKRLDESRYTKMLNEWESFLTTEHAGDGSMTNASRPVLTVAREYILSRYKKVITSGRKIDEKSTHSELHSLRIQCKKLRYLLEFFASLFSPADIELFVTQLKKIQDRLGEYNDLSVQQQELRGHLTSISATGRKGIQEAAALGGLITLLNYTQDDMRVQFRSLFAEFSNKESSALFHRLFD